MRLIFEASTLITLLKKLEPTLSQVEKNEIASYCLERDNGFIVRGWSSCLSNKNLVLANTVRRFWNLRPDFNLLTITELKVDDLHKRLILVVPGYEFNLRNGNKRDESKCQLYEVSTQPLQRSYLR